ncbi:MAG: 50S ribosomal protein L11 methyltransferase [Candidatus Wallbacteria bacterium]|nr:50S ribosomal protein L11 methyltransferase [Candidatus Wallbacteria bacterium]
MKYYLLFTEIPAEKEPEITQDMSLLFLGSPIVEYLREKSRISFYLPHDYPGIDQVPLLLEARYPGCSFNIEEIEDYWSTKLHGDFRPLQCGRFRVIPEHLMGGLDDQAQGKSIYLLPGQAFGTGQHETTALMLEIMSGMDFAGRSVLDVGCGTGVLSLASKMSGAAKVLGIDNDPLAVENARHNLNLNGGGPGIEFQLTDLARMKSCEWNFVFANIILSVLTEYRKEFFALAGQGAWLAFSGITSDQGPEFIEIFDFLELECLKKNDWLAFFGRKRQSE